MNSKRQKLVEVAKAYFLEDRTQAEIAKQLGISRSQVSRYLTEAREDGIIQIRIIDNENHSTRTATILKERYSHLKHVIIIHSFEHTPEIIRSNIGRYAANFLVETIQPGLRITLGCGRTMEAMVKALPERKIADISVIQAMGNLGHEAHKIDYNEIARVATEKLGGKVHYLSAPAILGAGSGSAEEFLRTNPMLAGALSIANKADMFLFGINCSNLSLFMSQSYNITKQYTIYYALAIILKNYCVEFINVIS